MMLIYVQVVLEIKIIKMNILSKKTCGTIGELTLLPSSFKNWWLVVKKKL